MFVIEFLDVLFMSGAWVLFHRGFDGLESPQQVLVFMVMRALDINAVLGKIEAANLVF
jgi:hypothetical protein